MAIIEKKSGLDVKAILAPVEKPHPDERWEGKWTFRDDDPENEFSFQATARLTFAAGLVEGRGVMTEEGYHVFDADISGTATGDELAFTVFVMNEEIENSLVCTAQLSNERLRMTGTFTHPCFNTGECDPDCQGGWGDFEMRRVFDA